MRDKAQLYSIAGKVIKSTGFGSIDLTDCISGLENFRIESFQENHDILVEKYDCEYHFNSVIKIVKSLFLDNYTILVLKSCTGYIISAIDQIGVDRTFFFIDINSNTIHFDFYNRCSPTYNRLVNKFSFWLAFGVVLQKYDIIALHSSVVVRDGQAIMFLGGSGTGKSTQSSLWVKLFDNTFILNDDAPFVQVINNQIITWGSPWSGKRPIYRNESYPVKAIVRLTQGEENVLIKNDYAQAFASLYPSCNQLHFRDQQLSERVISNISNMVSCTNCYSLKCNLEDESALILSKELFK